MYKTVFGEIAEMTESLKLDAGILRVLHDTLTAL